MSAANGIPPNLAPDERAEIRRGFAKALLHLGLGILLPLIYFWALIASLVSRRNHAAISETISLAFGIGFFRSSALALTCCSAAWTIVLFTPITFGIRGRFAIAAPIIGCSFSNRPAGIGRESSTRKAVRARSSTDHCDAYTPTLSGDTSQSA